MRELRENIKHFRHSSEGEKVSWHCAYCDKSEKVTGYVTIHNITGGIPFVMVCHLSCLRKKIPSTSIGIKESLEILDEYGKENSKNG